MVNHWCAYQHFLGPLSHDVAGLIKLNQLLAFNNISICDGKTPLELANVILFLYLYYFFCAFGDCARSRHHLPKFDRPLRPVLKNLINANMQTVWLTRLERVGIELITIN